MHVIEGTVPRRRFISSIKCYNDYYVLNVLRISVFHKHPHAPTVPAKNLGNFRSLSLCLFIFNRLIKYPLEINVADIDSCKFPFQRQILY